MYRLCVKIFSMAKVIVIFIIIGTLLGAYYYYNEYRTPVLYEGTGRSARCIRHTNEFGENYYSDSYLDRIKNVFRNCPKAEGAPKGEILPESQINR